MPCQIVPALLAKDEDELTKLQEALSFAPFIQLDIMDGRFVSSTSIPLDLLKTHPCKNSFEVHLMVYQPENYLQTIKEIGACGVVFHVESTDNPFIVIKRAQALGLKASLAINPDTSYNVLQTFVNLLDSVLFMTVYPGFYGAQFEPKVLQNIKDFKALYSHVKVAVDGGAKATNIQQIKAAGVDIICVGSAIVNEADPRTAYSSLIKLVNE